MQNRTNRPNLTLIVSTIAVLFLITIPVFSDNLAIKPDDTYIRYDEILGGFILAVRASPGMESILITESSADPEGKQDVYAYRTISGNSLNSNEKRIIDGYLLKNEGEEQFLMDSSPEPDSLLGEAFKIFIPRKLVFGYPWSRNGEITVGSGTWLNIRSFEKPFADYGGAWYDNPFIIDSNGTAVDEEGFTREIRKMIPDEIMEQLEESGMTIYSGNTPPILEGTFIISPTIMISSSIANEAVPHQFADSSYTFSNQSNHDLTIEVIQEQKSVGSKFEGTGGFIVGQDGNFTIFAEIHQEKSDSWARTAEIISGELKGNGIKNLQFSIVMLEKSGDNDYINVGEGRLFYDGDSFSEKE